MAEDIKRFGRRVRPGEDTGTIPAVDDDITGEIPVQVDDETDLEVQDPGAGHAEPDDDDELPWTGNGALLLWTELRKRLPELGDRLQARLGAGLRTRLPRLGTAMLARLSRLGASIVAGLLLCSSFPGFGWWWAAIVAFALLACVLTDSATTPLGGLGYGFLFGLTFYLPLVHWISILVGVTPLLALVVVCSVFPGIFGLSAVVVRRFPGWPLWFAVLWAAQEWLKSVVPFGGFPWGVVAAGQTDGPFLPLVRLGGVPLLSFAIVLVGCSAAAITLEIVSWWRATRQAAVAAGRDTRHADVGLRDSPPAVMLPTICICVAFFATVVIWPQVRHSGTGSGNEPVVTAAAVQGNVPRLGLDFNAQRLAVLRNHLRETGRLAEDVRAGRAPQPQFIVWPEDASEVDPLRHPDAALQISAAVEAIKAPILVGALTEVPGRPPDAPAEMNTVIVWNPRTGPADRHDKRIVQPFGEYLPWRGFFRHLSALADWAGYIVPGKGTGVVHAAGIPVGVATCWEVIFDRALRDSVRNGAQVLAVPANNANFNKTMSEQQLAFAKVRAVENDRYAVVASNTGISAVVTPDGRELARTGFFQPGYLDTQLHLKTTLTPAAKWGPIVQGVLVVAAVAVLLAAMLHNGWFTGLNRRLSRLAKNFGPSAETSDDDRFGDDVVAEDGEDTELDEGGRHSAR
jgi:apolipoprotein N-acyltransferase